MTSVHQGGAEEPAHYRASFPVSKEKIVPVYTSDMIGGAKRDMRGRAHRYLPWEAQEHSECDRNHTASQMTCFTVQNLGLSHISMGCGSEVEWSDHLLSMIGSGVLWAQLGPPNEYLQVLTSGTYNVTLSGNRV